MATREEIREGIDMKSPIPQTLNRVFLELLTDYDTYKTGHGDKCLDACLARAIANTIYELHSQGVVIKVDRELPDCPIPFPQATMDEGYNRGFERGFKVGVIEMLENTVKAGHVAVEPLIKED